MSDSFDLAPLPPEPDQPSAPPADDPGQQPGLDDIAAELDRVTRYLAELDVAGCGDRQLLRLVAGLAPVIDRLTAAHISAFGHAEQRGATITVDGLLPDAWLALMCRRSWGERRATAVAAEALADMPRLRAAFAAGVVSWAEVRAVCLKAATLSAGDRQRLDQALAGDADRLARMGADQLLDRLQQILDQLRPVDLERRERRDFESQYVAFRPRLDGTGEIHGDLDAAAFTDIASRVADTADQLPSPPGHADQPRAYSRGLRQAVALHALVTQRPTGRDDSARLLLTVEGATLTDTGQSQLNLPTEPDDAADRGWSTPAGETRMRAARSPAATATTPAKADAARPVLALTAPAGLHATLHTRSGRRPVSPRLLARLIPGAELRLLLTRDGVPLRAGRRRRYASLAQRDAALSLYGGCAWPRCPAPWWTTQMHHIVDFNGPSRGSTDADNLVPQCPVHHHALTHGHWTMRLLADRSVEVRRGRHRYRSLPRGQPARASPHHHPAAA